MKQKLSYKKLGLPIAIVAVAGVSTFAASGAYASSAHPRGGMRGRVSQGAIEQRYEKRLARAVSDGKLTATQEAAILSEYNTLQAERQAAGQPSTKTEMQKLRAEATSWAKQHNIDVKWLLPLRGRPHRL